MGDRRIPPALMRRILAFLTPGRNGQIVINVTEGLPVSCQFNEHVKVADLVDAHAAVDSP